MLQRIQSQQLRQYVMFGVTTLRDTAGGPVNLEVRERIERGEAFGPAPLHRIRRDGRQPAPARRHHALRER